MHLEDYLQLLLIIYTYILNVYQKDHLKIYKLVKHMVRCGNKLKKEQIIKYHFLK